MDSKERISREDIDKFLSAVAKAEEVLRDEKRPDGNLAVFMVRDYAVLRAIGLSGLAWAMYREGHTPQYEGEWFFSRIRERLENVTEIITRERVCPGCGRWYDARIGIRTGKVSLVMTSHCERCS